jgi:hypothetical protein
MDEKMLVADTSWRLPLRYCTKSLHTLVHLKMALRAWCYLSTHFTEEATEAHYGLEVELSVTSGSDFRPLTHPPWFLLEPLYQLWRVIYKRRN